MKLNNAPRPVIDKNSPEYFASRVNAARSNLLAALIFTVVNIVLYLVGSSSYFLFSMFLPYNLFGEGVAMSVVAGALLLIYLLCWFKSKEKRGWLIAALVLFIIDTVAFIGLIVILALYGDFEPITSSPIDIAFHVWVLISLISGIRNAKKLEEYVPDPEPDYIYQSDDFVNQTSDSE